jgi:peptide/nickel transport system substrate-binding protein
VFLSNRVPPFDNVDARRAVNFAVDRSAAVAAKGGEQVAHATCQLLPGSFPGHRDYCPYTANPAPGGAGPWTGPDLVEARRLVARSGTRGMHVTVVGGVSTFPGEARLIAKAMNRIGYRARVRLLPDNVDYFPYIQNTDHHVQAATVGWGADWPSPWGFLSGPFTCSSLRRGVDDQANTARFCDPGTDRLMARAQKLPGGDPRADRLWAEVDRRITDLAPVVPLVNPKAVLFASRRVGNFQSSRQWGVVLERLWVR